MKSNKHIICCFAALSLLVAGCGKTEQATDSEKQVQEFTKTEQGSYIERTETTIEAVRGGVLHLVSKQGDVEVDSWRRDEVRVLVEKRSDVSDEAQALALFEAFQVTTIPVSDTVQVQAGARGEGPLESVMVRLIVRVPSQFGVHVETAKGGIVIRDLEGDVEARTDYGGVTFNSVKGDVKAETGAGGITVNGGDGSWEVKTGRGGITFNSVKGDVKAETGAGGITMNSGDGSVEVKTDRGGITFNSVKGDVKAETGAGGITVNSVDGSVEVKADRGGDIAINAVKGDVKAETGAGAIIVEAEAPGGSVVVKTSEGDIEISGALGYIEATSRSGSIEAELRIADEGVDTHCKLLTGSGDVTIYLAKELAATIDAELRIEGLAHRDWAIYSDFPIDIREESESRIVGRGEINGGGDSIVLRTKNGDIHIKKLKKGWKWW